MNKFALSCLLAGAIITADAATISGTVTDGTGSAAGSTFVTARNKERRMAVTVLTDSRGIFVIDDLAPGTYEIRGRRVGAADGMVDGIVLTAHGTSVNLVLGRDDPAHLSTPGSAWLATLPEGPTKAQFVSSCTICHDMGSVVTRTPRSSEQWHEVIARMREQTDVYSVMLTMDDTRLAQWLADHKFGENPAKWDFSRPRANVVTNARLTEYEVGDIDSWAHDMAVEPATGAAWVGDYIHDVLIRIDPRSGEQKTFASPVKGAGMHTLNFDQDGALWITMQFADMVARFEPHTASWRIFGGFSKGTYVHSFALDSLGLIKKDSQGRMWLSQFGGNRLASFDPATGKVQEYPVAGTPSGRLYGVSLDSAGRVWYTKYSENMLGWLDPVTGKSDEMPAPRADAGPHRMHIDDDDNLWIPLSGYGTLWKYNTRSGASKEISLPDPDTFPYVNFYDGKSKRLWVAANGANSIYALDPKTERFTTYRLPAINSYPRMISIDYTTGDLWTALSSYPNKHSLRDHGLMLRISDALDSVAEQRSGK